MPGVSLGWGFDIEFIEDGEGSIGGISTPLAVDPIGDRLVKRFLHGEPSLGGKLAERFVLGRGQFRLDVGGSSSVHGLVHELMRDKCDWPACDRECYSKWLSETLPDGFELLQKYKGSWWVTKRLALERDEFTCQRCGATKDDLGRNPDVHHLEPVRTFEDPDDAHTVDTVVCLCPAGHTQVERYGGTVDGEPGDNKNPS